MRDRDTGDDWQATARGELLRLRVREGGWGYRAGTAPGVEPTVLACLGLLADHDVAEVPADEMTVVTACADWLATIQRPDGSLGLSAAGQGPGWTTPLALLLWQATATHQAPRLLATTWLLGQRGERIIPGSDDDRIMGHDTTLVGWPWVGGTHSWLEPTAMAVLALRRAGLDEHPRVVEGYQVIRDRAIETGGWNYGNTSVFGHVLRPQPAPTGMALLALAHRDDRSELINRAIHYLDATLPEVRASASLAWGLLGLRAWGSAPEPSVAQRWLAEAARHVSGRNDAAPKLALLLLAGGDHAIQLFE